MNQRLYQIANVIQFGMNFAGFAIAGGAQFTVLANMDVFGVYPQVLNHPTSLASEASYLPKRIAIVSEANPSNISMYNGLAPGNPGTWTGITRAMALTYSGFYEFYATYTNYSDPAMWVLRQDAWKWAWGSTQLFGIDYYWCNMMDGYWDGQCHGDGIVSVNSQQWPGSTSTLFIPNGPTHSNETRDSNVHLRVIQALQTNGFVFTP